MEMLHSEGCAGRHDNMDEKNESVEGCPSLARSDSGQGKSLSSLEGNITLDEVTNLESTKEIDDTSENGIFEDTTARKTNNQNYLSRHKRTGVCKNQDSGIEKSPASQHLKSSHHLPETNHEDMSYRKQQKDMFEGPVSDLTSVDREKLSLKRQAYIDSTSDFDSLYQSESFCGLPSSSKIPHPEISLPSSSDSHRKCCHLVNSAQYLVNAVHECNISPCNISPCNISPHNYVLNNMQTHTDVNGYNQDDNTRNPYPVGVQNGRPLISALSEAASSVCPMSPQGMVPKWMLDTVIKELTFAKKKISELEHENPNLYEYLEIKEQLEIKECELQAKQEELQAREEELQAIQEELQAKQEELQAREEKLSLQHADLASLEAIKNVLEVKDHELQTLRVQCQTLMFQNEGLKPMVESGTVSDDVHNELQSVLRIRTGESSSDETQPKTL